MFLGYDDSIKFMAVANAVLSWYSDIMRALLDVCMNC